MSIWEDPCYVWWHVIILVTAGMTMLQEKTSLWCRPLHIDVIVCFVNYNINICLTLLNTIKIAEILYITQGFTLLKYILKEQNPAVKKSSSNIVNSKGRIITIRRVQCSYQIDVNMRRLLNFTFTSRFCKFVR